MSHARPIQTRASPKLRLLDAAYLAVAVVFVGFTAWIFRSHLAAAWQFAVRRMGITLVAFVPMALFLAAAWLRVLTSRSLERIGRWPERIFTWARDEGPTVGIFGTVIGIYQAFDELAGLGQSSRAALQVFATSVQLALFTTAVGAALSFLGGTGLSVLESKQDGEDTP